MKFLKNGLLAIVLSWSAASSATIINFNDYALSSYANQDGAGSASVVDGGATLQLTGNTWKSLAFNYNVTASTVLYFDFMSTLESESTLVGLDNNNSVSANTLFQLFGTQDTSALDAFYNYSIADGWTQYTINLGSFFTGSFDRLVFANDQDAGSVLTNSIFSNLEICDGCQRTVTAAAVPAPSSILLMGLTLLLVGFRRFKQ